MTNTTTQPRPRPARVILAATLFVGPCLAIAADAPPAWKTTKTVSLEGLKVSLSDPVLVARSKGYLWFPSMTRLANGEFFAILSTSRDGVDRNRTSVVSWSGDGGLTWSEPSSIDPRGDLYSECTLRLLNGDELLYPFNLYPRPGGMGAPYQVVSGQKGKREVRLVKGGVTVAGWPRPDKSFDPKLGLSG
jgi:hypothetical protein